MACRVFLLALATLCIARQAEQTHRNPLGFSLVTAPPRDATLSGVRPRISGAFGCSRVNQGSSQTRKGFRERSRMAELLWQEPLCMTPNGVEKAIAETSVAVKFGSSSEERRKSSAPNARSVGLRLILLGKPCSGKGTQAPMICRKYRCVHVSVGNLLRAEVRIGSELGVKAATMMKEGKLLPDDIVNDIVQNRLAQDDCMNNGWILDGYPRTVSQVRALEALGIIPDAVIVLDRPDEVVREWCRGRKTEPSTGIIYHPTYNPPPENVCTHLVARDDDHPEVIERRLEQYRDSRDELLGEYGARVCQVDTYRHELDAFKDICEHLDAFCPVDKPDVMPIELDQARNAEMRRLDRERGVVEAGGKREWSLLDIVNYCNSHDPNGFIPVFAGKKRVGYIGKSMAGELFADPGYGTDFWVALDSCSIKTGQLMGGFLYLAPSANTVEERTEVVQMLVKRLRATGAMREMAGAGSEEGGMVEVSEIMRPRAWDGSGLIMRVERGADAFFGVPLYGVHINGIVRGQNGVDSVWIAKRSESKVLYPGLFDQMVSHHQGSRRRGTYVWSCGGSFLSNTVSAAQREAAVNVALLESSLRPSGLVSYRYETALGLVTKILHVYDIELPEFWRPFNGNGEVDGFTLVPIHDVLRDMKSRPHEWKPNSMLVNIDLAVRRGYLSPDHPDYLELIHGLRVPDKHQAWAEYSVDQTPWN